jgi:hypothetical protein
MKAMDTFKQREIDFASKEISHNDENVILDKKYKH